MELDLTKNDIEILKSRLFLTELQEKILDLKIEGNLTEYGIAVKLKVSESTVQYQWKKVKRKILKVF